MPRERQTVDAAIARVAARQHGVVSRAQLRAAGLAPSAIERRVLSARLHRVHRGVYALAPPPHHPFTGHHAALLACGDEAVLSHASAAALWRIAPAWPEQPEVSVPRSRRSVAGVTLHRTRSLPPDQTTRRHGFPTTTVERTLLDLAETTGTDELVRALGEAQYLRLTTHRRLTRLLDASPGRHGVKLLRDLLHDGGATHSQLEARFLALIRHARLPAPEVNARIGPYRVDFLWRERRMIVETDGWQAHGTRTAFERDRRRDAELAARGFRVLRVTSRQLEREPVATVAAVAGALAA